MTLTQEMRDKIAEIAGDFTVDLFVLFGSLAKGVAHSASDVDIAYRVSGDLSIEAECRLSLALSSLFRTEAIDLVDLSKAAPLLRYGIMRDGILLYEKHRLEFSQQASYAFKNYIDAKILYRMREARVQERIDGYDI